MRCNETPLSLSPVIPFGTNVDIIILITDIIATTVNTFSLVSVCPVIM